MRGKEKKIRILIAKVGLDTHDKGAKLVARACRDAGMEVIYLGSEIQTAEQVAQAAIQEDVGIVGLSILSGAHLTQCKKVLNQLKDKIVIVGGAIPNEDIRHLKEIGVAEVFPTGTPMSKIIAYIKGIYFKPL